MVPSSAYSPAKVSKKTIGVGIVGTGFGTSVLLPAFQSFDAVQVVGVASRSKEQSEEMARKYSLMQTFESWKELVSCPDIQAVCIATPPSVRKEIIMAALSNGKAVFSEKPLAMDASEAEELLHAAKKAGVVHMVDFEFREIPAFASLRQLLQDGEAGSLRHAEILWSTGGWSDPMRSWSWQADQKQGGGTLTALGIHACDYIQWFFGPIARVSATSGISVPKRPDREGNMKDVTAEDHFQCIMELSSGAHVTLTISQVAPRGTGHRIAVHGSDVTALVESHSVHYAKGFTMRVAKRGEMEFQVCELGVFAREVDEHPDSRIPVCQRLCEKFLDAVRDGRTDASPSFLDGLRAQRVLDAIRLSCREKKWIDISS
ncbi:MAG: Gfo/Idh/MocA family oxidoreductase [Patescibacteria group bacterium]